MNKKAIIKEIVEGMYCIIIAVVLALTVKYFLINPTVVKQSSMYDTLETNQRLILNRWAKTIKSEIKRGDIVTFESPTKISLEEKEVDLSKPEAIYKVRNQNILQRFNYSVLEINKKSYIKRVIGIAGDHVRIANGNVFLNEKKLDEDYLYEAGRTESDKFYDIVVPEGYIFVMGDNRTKSTDSRDFGCIPIDKVDSKVALRFWPLDVFGKVE